jgi:hypothetical protein
LPVALAESYHRSRTDSVVDPLERGQRQVEKDRIKLGMQMDDRQFQGALVDTQVGYSLALRSTSPMLISGAYP